MDDRAVRLECLKLALTTRPAEMLPPLERAALYEAYVIGDRTPHADKAASAPDGLAGKTARKPATKASTSPA